MGVWQDIGVRVRSLLYDRAERFIAAEDGRRTEGLRERFNDRFVEFYEVRHLGDRGYEGYADFNARRLFEFYDRFGEKGLELLRFQEGVKLDSGDILNLRHFVERCELIENSDKGLNRGINLATRLVDAFSLDEIVDKLNSFRDPELLYVLGLRHELEEMDRQREELAPLETVDRAREEILEVEIVPEFEKANGNYISGRLPDEPVRSDFAEGIISGVPPVPVAHHVNDEPQISGQLPGEPLEEFEPFGYVSSKPSVDDLIANATQRSGAPLGKSGISCELGI